MAYKISRRECMYYIACLVILFITFLFLCVCTFVCVSLRRIVVFLCYCVLCQLAPRLSAKDTTPSSRKKDRSRSKSPFRSFRWKKSSPKGAVQAASVSDDEGNLERAAERPSPSGEESQLEGLLVRKHEWEATTKKASNRSWDKVWVVIRGTLLTIYKDNKSAKTTPEAYYKGESPIDLRGGTAEVATNYTKKKHVFRVKLGNGAEYLFQAKDDDEMRQWVSVLSKVCEMQGSGGPSRSHTLPAPQEPKDEPKRRSFFTLKRN